MANLPIQRISLTALPKQMKKKKKEIFNFSSLITAPTPVK
jgi:hypothetical protein